MMTVGGVDTYYDYDERKWKSRRLGGRPVRTGPVCPVPPEKPADSASEANAVPAERSDTATSTRQYPRS